MRRVSEALAPSALIGAWVIHNAIGAAQLCALHAVVPVLILAESAVLLVWVAFFLLARSLPLAHLATSALLVALWSPPNPIIGLAAMLPMIGLVWLTHRKKKTVISSLSTLLGFFSWALLGLSLMTLWQTRGGLQTNTVALLPLWRMEDHSAENLPDIWHITLDGYGSHESLQRRMGWDEPLSAALTARGFRVIPQARANYMQTTLSMATLANGAPLDTLLEHVHAPNRVHLRHAFSEGRAFRSLRVAGYRIVDHRSAYSALWLRGADQTHWAFPALGAFVWSNTRLPNLFGFTRGSPLEPPNRLRIAHMRSQFASIRPDLEVGPALHFAHVLAPHPAFVLDEQGQYTYEPSGSFLEDGSHWHSLHPNAARSYADGYTRQATWTAEQTLAAVDRLLAAENPPIIVIHGDHGSKDGLNWEEMASTDLNEVASILLAVYAPAEVTAQLYDDMTLVNLYPAIFRGLGAQTSLNADRCFYSTWSEPFALQEIER